MAQRKAQVHDRVEPIFVPTLSSTLPVAIMRMRQFCAFFNGSSNSAGGQKSPSLWYNYPTNT